MSDETPIRLVLADVDGTLVTKDKILTERAVAATRALQKAGADFAITSGRPPRGMKMLVEPLALKTAIAGFNGGVFVHPDLTVIETHTLDPAAARKAAELIEKAGLDVWLYTPDDWFIRDPNAPHVAREAWTVKFDAKVVKTYPDEVFEKVVKIVGVSDDLDRVAKTEREAQQELGKTVSAARSQPYYLDVTHPNANKGMVIETLSRLMKIRPEEIATLGDMPNDVLMFEKSGFSVAMGNASDEVKSKASATTDSYEDEGFAKAVERLILPRVKARTDARRE
ncbi:MAG: HAD family phosphatase [Caulobacteraceae bacterium]|nr:HAD family phosphatase [Caulobacteraceae bacterium]